MPHGDSDLSPQCLSESNSESLHPFVPIKSICPYVVTIITLCVLYVYVWGTLSQVDSQTSTTSILVMDPGLLSRRSSNILIKLDHLSYYPRFAFSTNLRRGTQNAVELHPPLITLLVQILSCSNLALTSRRRREMSTMGDLSSTSASLLYFPIKQFSPRFGDCFFTVEILSFTKRKASSKLCCLSDVVFYEVEVKRGRLSWRVFRRYNEFASLFESLDNDEFSFPPNSLVGFPKKSIYSNFIHDAAFLEKRKKQLETVLDNILTAASTRSVPITRCTAITTFLQLSQDRTSRLPLM